MTDVSITATSDTAGVVRLAVAGEVDMASSGALATALGEAVQADGTKQVAVDLSRVTFLDSSGIRTLLLAHGLAGQRGVRFYVTDPPHNVRRVLEITSVLALLTSQDPAGDA